MAIDLKKLIRQAREIDKIITPIYVKWLAEHGNDPYPPDIAMWVAEQLAIPPRARTAAFSPSSSGRCERRQVLEFIGVQPTRSTMIDPQLQNIFDDGRWNHLRWQAAGLWSGFLDDAEFPVFWKRKHRRGSLDGVGTVRDDHPRIDWRGKQYGVEFKMMNGYKYEPLKKRMSSEDAKELIKQEHQRQYGGYFEMTGLDLFVVIYEDKNFNDWIEWVVEPEETIMEEVEGETNRLAEAIDTKTLPPILPACAVRTGPEFKECPFGGKEGPLCLTIRQKWITPGSRP